MSPTNDDLATCGPSIYEQIEMDKDQGIADFYSSSINWATFIGGFCLLVFVFAWISFWQDTQSVGREISMYNFGVYRRTEVREELQKKVDAIQQTRQRLSYFFVLILAIGLYITIAFLVVLYKAWAAIQDGGASMGPRKAVGLLFVPLVNLAWVFVAVPGFVDEYNRYLFRHDLEGLSLTKRPFIIFAVLLVLSVLPLIGYLTSLIVPVYACILVSRLSEAINDLPELPNLECQANRSLSNHTQ